MSLVVPAGFFEGQGGGGFNPSDYGTPLFWLDASQETGYANGDNITTLVDWSGAGNNFTGASGSMKYQTGRINGLPVFDCNNSSAFSSPSINMGADYTEFHVIVPIGVGGYVSDNSATWTGHHALYMLESNGGSNDWYWLQGPGSTIHQVGNITLGTPTLITLTRQNNGFRQNGVATTLTTAAAHSTASRNAALSSGTTQGNFESGEWLYYAENLSIPNIEAIEAVIMTKWGI